MFASQHEIRRESDMADRSPTIETSTNVDPDDKNQRFDRDQSGALAVVSDSSDRSKENFLDQKTLRRLVQNREAARKSRLRKKAYVQQLESHWLKLTQLEQEVQQARPQEIDLETWTLFTIPSGSRRCKFLMNYYTWPVLPWLKHQYAFFTDVVRIRT